LVSANIDAYERFDADNAPSAQHTRGRRADRESNR
jgi:hypothetical protein